MDDEDVHVAHRRLDLDAGLSIGELSKIDLVGTSAESFANAIGQDGVATAAEDTRLTHVEDARGWLLYGLEWTPSFAEPSTCETWRLLWFVALKRVLLYCSLHMVR